jgi:hypothetical protein
LGFAAVAMEAVALVLLLQVPSGNSALWFPLNACYFGGILVALAAAIAGFIAVSEQKSWDAAIPLALALVAVVVNRLAAYH